MRGGLRGSRPAAVVVLAGALALAGAACGTKESPKAAPGLPARTVTAGAVTVKVTPARLDASGAEFAVSFDTHSVELDLDVARSARLEVDGVAWSPPAWSGDGPSGHHRQGTLRFPAGGPAAGTARLVISGLPAPAEASWDLAARS